MENRVSSATPQSLVWAAPAENHDPPAIARAMHQLLGAMTPNLSTLVKSGDRVLVKPYLTHGGSSSPNGRQISHPNFLRCLIEAVRDCGGRVEIGDVRTMPRGTPVPADRRWIYALAEETGAKPVSFARAGLRQIRSGLLYPRYFYISNAVLDADVVINCANAMPHDGLLLSGAIRNMFNVIAGRQQDQLYQLYDNGPDLGQAIAQVFKTVRPAVSFLDMTTIREAGHKGTVRPVGLVLASQDAVALDTVAQHVLGYSQRPLWTSILGEKLGLGAASLTGIEVRGAEVRDFLRTDLRLPRQLPNESLSAGDVTKQILKDAAFVQKPSIVASSCNGCGDCVEICPLHAIETHSGGKPSIKTSVCIDCGYCDAICPTHAVRLKPVGLSRWWNQAKSGMSFGVGPLRLHVRLSRNPAIGKPVRSRYGHRSNAARLPKGLEDRPAE